MSLSSSLNCVSLFQSEVFVSHCECKPCLYSSLNYLLYMSQPELYICSILNCMSLSSSLNCVSLFHSEVFVSHCECKPCLYSSLNYLLHSLCPSLNSISVPF
jgi:hypothetical protein